MGWSEDKGRRRGCIFIKGIFFKVSFGLQIQAEIPICLIYLGTGGSLLVQTTSSEAYWTMTDSQLDKGRHIMWTVTSMCFQAILSDLSIK